jgi:HNH endonuclease
MVEVTCVHCSCLFSTFPSILAANKGRFCSALCRYAFAKQQSLERLPQRFWSQVVIAQNFRDCWLWTGRRDNNGYGKFSCGVDHDNILAHRMAYHLFYGPFFSILNVLHKCNVPPCCNPHHLYLGTQSDNAFDALRAGRRITPMLGEKHPGHKLTMAQVLDIRDRCKTTTLKVLAKQFHVSIATIWRIKQNKRWIDVH